MSQIKQEMVVNWETRMLQWVIRRLLGVLDTDDVKQKNKPWNNTKQILPCTENKEVFCFTLSVSGKRRFDHSFQPDLCY